MVHVGVDLHKRSSQIEVLTEEGELKEQQLENEPAKVQRFFERIPAPGPGASGRWGDEPRVRRWKTIPGIGPFTATRLKMLFNGRPRR